MKRRKINKAKRQAHSCRNNGPCPYCRSSRTHSTRRREPITTPEETTTHEQP